MTLVHEHDITAVLERVSMLEAQAAHLEETVAALRAENAELYEIIDKQQALIRKLQRMLFGKKSEKGPGAPKPDAPGADAAAPEEESAPGTEPAPSPDCGPSPEPGASSPADQAGKRPRGQRHGAPGHGRRLYEDLPPREVFHYLPAEECQCPHCGAPYEPNGTEDAIEIEWEVLIRRLIHRRCKYRRTCSCETTPLLCTAPAPPKLIPKGLLSVSAIANLVVNKFLHGQPIHRQIHELELHSGVRLAPGTLVGVQDKVGELLRPLYHACLLHLRTADHWHADETRWMQFGDETKHRWWLWVFASHDTVLFVLDPTRSRAVPRRVFGLDAACWEDDPDDPRHVPACGNLTCDRWKSYQGLPGIRTSYCWSHVRRDFTDLGTGYPDRLGAWAKAWVERIGTLYHLTDQRLGGAPGTEVFRQADATLRAHVERLAQMRDAELAGPGLLAPARSALESLIRHWDGLVVFLDHLEVPLDNNAAERLLRTSVVGRKNFYGSGSYTSGDLAECAYTVLLTAAQNGLNPLTYLRAYLDACAANGGQAPADLEHFLPWQAGTEDLATWQRPPQAGCTQTL